MNSITKRCYIALLLILTSSPTFCQSGDTVEAKQGVKVELGYMVISNSLNADDYYEFKSNIAKDNENSYIRGVNLKFTFPTRVKYLDVTAGALLIKCLDEIYLGYVNPASAYADAYNLNGGGVYLGISPKLKGKHFGLTSDLAVGVLSFKEYVSIVINDREPNVDEHNLKASYGLGAVSSVGFYVSFWKMGINPSLTCIFSGGASSSFTFWGLNIPITIQF